MMGFFKNKFPRSVIILIVLIITAVFAYQGLNEEPSRTELTYSEFRQHIENGDVISATISNNTIKGSLQGGGSYRTNIPSNMTDEVVEMLEDQSVDITAEPAGQGQDWMQIVASWVPTLILFGFLAFIMFRMSQAQSGAGQIFQAGQSNDTMLKEERPDTTFDDVGGYGGPKKEVSQIIDYLQNPDKFLELGGQMPKGLLLMGPPGTGKTLMGRAIAGEAGVPFLHVSGSDFIEMFVGVGASRVRDLFDKAERNAPAIIFIDEFDSVGRKRGAGVGRGNDEREQTLNQLLDRMDGFEEDSGVIVIGATNRPDVLDPALMRPGRFDREVHFDLPSVNEREEILNLHADDKPLATDVDLREIAHSTIGMSGADLMNLLNEAAMFAAEEEQEEIKQEHLDRASDKIAMGREREELEVDGEEKRTLATHEAGHAICAYACERADDVHKITIVPRGKALGATQQQPEDERHIRQESEIRDRITVMLGGRAAEQLIVGEISSGAEDDIEKATDMAKRMVLKWGMDEDVGPVALNGGNGNTFLGEELGNSESHSEDTKQKADRAIREIIEEAQERATEIIDNNRQAFDVLVDELLDQEKLNADDVDGILSSVEIV